MNLLSLFKPTIRKSPVISIINSNSSLNNSEIQKAKRRGLFSSIRDLITQKAFIRTLTYYYNYESNTFLRYKEHATLKGHFKFITKTIDYHLDFVFNDVKGTHFNGLKTVISQNSAIHKVYKKFQISKPINSVRLLYRRFSDLFPRAKEFYNMTGGNRTYKIFQYIIDPHSTIFSYTHNLKNFQDVKSFFVHQGRNSYANITKNKYSHFIRKTRRKRYIRILSCGFAFRLRARKIFYRYKNNYYKHKRIRKNRGRGNMYRLMQQRCTVHKWFTRRYKRIKVRNIRKKYFKNVPKYIKQITDLKLSAFNSSVASNFNKTVNVLLAYKSKIYYGPKIKYKSLIYASKIKDKSLKNLGIFKSLRDKYESNYESIKCKNNNNIYYYKIKIRKTNSYFIKKAKKFKSKLKYLISNNKYKVNYKDNYLIKKYIYNKSRIKYNYITYKSKKYPFLFLNVNL